MTARAGLPIAGAVDDAPLSAATEGRDAPVAQPRPRAGYLWAMLLPRILWKSGPGMGLLGAPRLQIFPLSSPFGRAPMRIISFITEAAHATRLQA